jgi:uroporphyrinogen decarboxylase
LTSRERVRTAFAHEEPDRVPCWFGTSAEFQRKALRELGLPDEEALRVRLGDDFRRVGPRYVGPQRPLSPGAVSRTVFGVERAGLGYGQPLTHPLAEATLAQVHEYPWPDPRWWDVTRVRTDALAWRRQYAILGGDWSPFWHDIIDLLGMENLYLKMYDEPELVDAVLQHLVEYYAAASRRIFDAAGDAIDVFFIGNDFGGQTGALLSPAQFERFIVPHLQRLIRLGHDYRLKVQLHCCGGYEPLLPAMVRIGLDAVHAVQPCCGGMDLATLKARYGRQIVFNGAIDSQHVLIAGTPALVRQKTRDVLTIMAPGGGYIAGASHDSILEETPVENVVAMFDTIRSLQGQT